MAHWLVKSEPEVYSINHLKVDGVTLWDCVRNYQARNYLRDSFAVGDDVLFYHSNAEPSGIAGLAKITKIGISDPKQFDPKSEYFDSKAKKDAPIWYSPEIKFISKFKELISLASLREKPELKQMVLLKKGSRLSVQPVTPAEFKTIIKIAKR